MRIADIKVGKTYANNGRGLTIRKVLRIGHARELWEIDGSFWLGEPPPQFAKDQRCVLFELDLAGEKRKATMRLTSFANWAGYEVVGGRLKA